MKSVHNISKGMITGVHYRDMPEGGIAYAYNGILFDYRDGILAWKAGSQFLNLNDIVNISETIGSVVVKAFCEITDGVILICTYEGNTKILKIVPSQDFSSAELTELYSGSDISINTITEIKSYYEGDTIETLYWLDNIYGFNSLNIRGTLEEIAAAAPYTSNKNEYLYSNIVFKKFISGELISGNYFYAYRSKSTDGRIVSPWSIINGPVTPYSEPIPDDWDVKTFDFTKQKVLKPGEKTQTGVRLFIKKVDTNYDKIEVVAFYQSIDNEISEGLIFFSNDIDVDVATGGMYIDHISNIGSVISIEDVNDPGITIMDGTDFELSNRLNIVAGYEKNDELPETEIIKKNRIEGVTITTLTKDVPLYGTFDLVNQYMYPNGEVNVFPKKEPTFGNKENHTISLNKYQNQETGLIYKEVIEIDNDYPNYKGGLMSSMMGYFRSGETYRIGMLPIDKYGNKLGVRWLGDKYIPYKSNIVKNIRANQVVSTQELYSLLYGYLDEIPKTVLEWNQYLFPYPLRKGIYTDTSATNGDVSSNLLAESVSSFNYYANDTKPAWYTDFMANSALSYSQRAVGQVESLQVSTLDITDLVTVDENGNPIDCLIQGFHIVVAKRDKLYEDDLLVEPCWNQETPNFYEIGGDPVYDLEFNAIHRTRENYLKSSEAGQFIPKKGIGNIVSVIGLYDNTENLTNRNIEIKRKHRALYNAKALTKAVYVNPGDQEDAYMNPLNPEFTAKQGLTSNKVLKNMMPQDVCVGSHIGDYPNFNKSAVGTPLQPSHLFWRIKNTIPEAHTVFGPILATPDTLTNITVMSILGTTLWNLFTLTETHTKEEFTIKESKFLDELNFSESYDDQGVYLDSLSKKANNFSLNYVSNSNPKTGKEWDIGTYFAKNPACHLLVLDEDISTVYPDWGRGDMAFVGAIKNNKSIFYGGTSDEALSQTEYMSSWHYLPIDLTVLERIKKGTAEGLKFIFNNIEIMGGDTKLSLHPIHKEQRSEVLFHEGRFNNGSTYFYENKMNYLSAIPESPYWNLPSYTMYLPIESTRNLASLIENNLSEKGEYLSFVKKDENLNLTGEVVSNAGIGEIITIHGEDIPYIAKNNIAYKKYLLNSTDVQIGYYSLSPLIELINKYPNRITWSNFKYSNEPYDNFKIFNVFNYLEIEGNGGTIIKVAAKNQRLFFWQQKAIGYTPIKERSYVQDNTGQQIGVGTTESFKEYFIPITGKGLQNPKYFADVDNGFTWYDHFNESWYFMTYDFQLVDIFKDTNNHPLRETILKAFVYGQESINDIHLFSIPDTDLVALSNASPILNKSITIYFNTKLKVIVGAESKAIKYSFKYKEQIIGYPIYGYSEDAYIRFAVNPKKEIYKIFENLEIVIKQGNVKAIHYFNDEFDIQENINEFYTQRKNMLMGSIPLTDQGERIRGDYLCIDLIIDKDEDTSAIIHAINTTFREDWL